MRNRCLLIGLVLSGLAAGCPKPLTPDQRLANAAPAPALSLLQAAGDKAALVLLIHPDRWPAAARTLAPFFAGDSDLNQARAILAAPDLWTALGRLLAIETPGLTWPARLDGWDPSRPIVFALYQPELNETVLAARIVMPMEPGDQVPPLHHRILIPAIDARALLDSLTSQAGLFNWSQVPSAGELAGLNGGQVFQTSAGGLAALIPEADRLRIELLEGGYEPHQPADRNQKALAVWLSRPPTRAKLPITPALLFAASRRDLLVAHARPWVLRDLNNQLGAGMVLSALAMADPGILQNLMTAGLSEIAGGYLQMSPRGCEFDDWAFSLDLDSGLRLAGLASLTEQGLRVWTAGRSKAQAPLAATGGASLVDLSVSADTQSMLAAAQVPPGLEAITQAHAVFDSVAHCGFMCSLHYMLRAPMGLLKVLDQHMDDKTRIQFPQALAIRLAGIELGGGPVPLRLAVAASFSAGTDTRWLRQIMAGMAQQTQPELYTDRLGPAEITRLGVGLDPRRVFDLRPAQQAVGQIGSVTINPGGLANLVTHQSPALASALDKLDSIKGWAFLVDRALVGQLAIGLKGSPAPRPQRLPALTGLAWDSPGLAAASTQGAGCLAVVTRGMIAAVPNLAMAAVQERADLMAKALEGLAEPLACALAEPATRAEAQRVQLALALLEAGHLERQWKRAEQIQVLDQACGQGHERACHLADAARAGPRVNLAQTTGGCLEPWSEGEPVIRVGATEPAPARIASQVKADRVQAVPLLALDQGLTGDRLSAVGGALVASQIHRVGLLVQTPDRGLARIPIDLGLVADRPAAQAPTKTDEAPKVGILAHLGKRDEAFEPLDLALLVNPRQVKLRGPGGELVVSEGRRNLDAIAKKFDEVQQIFPRMRLQVLPSAETAWTDLAPVLAAAACGADDPTSGRPARALWLVLDPEALDARIPQVPASGRSMGKKSDLQPPDPQDPGGLVGLDLKVRPGQIRMGPPLPQKEILRVVREHKAGVRNCYERALVEDPKLKGKLVVSFTIGPKGTVTEASIKAGGPEDAKLRECLLGLIRGWVFPSPLGGGTVVVNYPFVFDSTE